MNAPRRNAGFRQCKGGQQVNVRESLPTARPFSYAAALSYPTSKTRLHRRSVTAFRRSQLAGELVLPARPFLYDAALSSAGTTGCALHGISLFPAATIARTAPSSRSVDALRRSELVRDEVSVAQPDLADKALKVALTSGFALLGESLLAIAGWPAAPKGTKRSCPCTGLGVPGSLRSTSLVPSALRGPAYKGHPCRWRPRPFTPLAASMPLAPLRADSIRPPERGVRSCLMVWLRKDLKSVSTQSQSTNRNFVGWKTAKHFPPRSIPQLISDLVHQKRWVSFALPTLQSLEARTTGSLHRPSDATKSPLSEGRAQVAWKGLSGMDAARALLGHGWPVAAGPWRVTGAREPRRSRGRMQGPAFLLTFLASEKSEPPSRAKPMPRPTRPIGHIPRTPKPKSFASMDSASPSPLQSLRLGFAPTLLHPVAPHRDSNEKRPLACA